MKEVALNNKDLFIMNLVHYFVTEKDYNPIILHGVDDEIWLENLDSDYRIVRIVCHYIHNNEQLKYDKFKLSQIIKKLKRKTLSLSLNTFTIYTDLGDNVDLVNDKNNESVYIKNEKAIKNDTLIEVFPDIVEKTKYDEKGIDLFVKITEDMNKNNIQKSTKLGKLFQTKRPVITYTIMALCILAFAMMCVFSGDPSSILLGSGDTTAKILLMFGANLKLLVVEGHQYYRLLTAAFLHIGLIHLIVNMYSLYIIGPQVENFFGRWKYLIIYLVSAISGSLLSLAFNDNTIIAGASGAIFGLLGALLYFGYYYRVYFSNAILRQIIPVLIVNLVIGLFVSGIDLAGHIGGLIGGLLTTMALGVPEKKKSSEKINGVILLIIYLVFIIYLSIFR